MTKVLANKLKSVIPDIILANQSVFIHGRLISDNTLIAYEVLHSMTNRFKGQARYMALKLDIERPMTALNGLF